MTRVDLSNDDIHDLIEVIDYRLGELRDELSHNTAPVHRTELDDAARRLESLRTRVLHVAVELPIRREPSALSKWRAPA